MIASESTNSLESSSSFSRKRLRCQRIGCDALYTEEQNVEGCCRYHAGAPLFHDGGKEWSCCKKKSHDFSLFLSIPGCTTGKHTTEKPVTKAAPSPNQPMQIATAGKPALDAAKLACPRCRGGFYCSDHGGPAARVSSPRLSGSSSSPRLAGSSSSPRLSGQTGVATPSTSTPAPASATAPRPVVDVHAKQTCKNKGCGQTFTELENHDGACSYHPGPAVFHDRSKGWACCDVHVKDFDEFMQIPTCAKGWHSASGT